MPASLAGVVAGVVGVDESASLVHPYIIKDAPPSPGFRNAPPLSDYWAEFVSRLRAIRPASRTPAAPPRCPDGEGLHPRADQGRLRHLRAYDGAGQTVAIIDAYASPTILQDVNQWSVNRGLPTMTASQLVQVVAPGHVPPPAEPGPGPAGLVR